MSRIVLSNDGLGTTSVSNVFIDHYMKDANDAQIKVYLYLLRNASANASFEIGDIADEFNHTEKDVVRALKFWEKAGLLRLQYDLTGEICQISFSGAETKEADKKEVQVSEKPVLSIVPATAGNMPVPAKPAVPEKPSYSLDDLKAFRAESEMEDLIAIAESYLVKTLSPTDLKSLLYIHKELSFRFEMIDLLLQYCVSKNKKSFNYIETVAISWYEQGITTPEQARNGIPRYDKTLFEIMAALGKNGTPTIRETEFMNRWIGTYGFSKEMILAACERTVLKTDSDRFPYAEGILSKWKAQGFTTLAQAEAAEADFRKKKTAPQTGHSSADSKPGAYPKSKYDFAALQKFINEN